MDVLLNGWHRLASAIDGTISLMESQKTDQQASTIKHLSRMTSLIECSGSFGLEAYRNCRDNSSTNLTTFNKRDDDFLDQLKIWKEYEQRIYEQIMPMLKTVGESARDYSHVIANDVCIPHLAELDRTLMQMQRQPSLKDYNLKRVVENTKYTIRMAMGVLNSKQVLTDRETFAALIEKFRY